MPADELMRIAENFFQVAVNPPLVEEDEGEDALASPLELNCRGALFAAYSLAKTVGVEEDNPNIARAEQLYLDSFRRANVYEKATQIMQATMLVNEAALPKFRLYTD
jgi:hypothetical protein